MSKKNKTGNFLGGLSESRKMEIAGILIMAVGGLLGFSIITFNAADFTLIQALSADNLFTLDRGPALRIQNGLGVVGAYLAHLLVYLLFGYMSIIIPLILLGYGWFIFRRRNITELLWPTAYGIWCMVLFSSILGWFNLEYDWYSSVWNGSAGLGMARVLQNFTSIGSIIILFVLLITTLMAILNRDLQSTVDKFKWWITDNKNSFAQCK